jgi:GGDEF domain-containing protein
VTADPPLGVSAGVAVVPPHGADVTELMEQADGELDAAKSGRRAR